MATRVSAAYGKGGDGSDAFGTAGLEGEELDEEGK